MINCFRFSHTEDYRSELHSHPEGQFFILLKGVAVYQADNLERVMTARRPCWVPPYMVHGVTSTGDMQGITLHVSSEDCAQLPDKLCIYKPDAFVDMLAEKMLDAREDLPRLNRLWQVMSDELNAAEQDDFFLPVPKNAKLRKLTDLLAQNAGDQRGLGEWAQEVNMAQRTLVRKFREETGLSFVEWRQRARVMQAIKLLSAGDSVTDVAFNVGYESLSAFISVFKQVKGMSPAAYMQTSSAS